MKQKSKDKRVHKRVIGGYSFTALSVPNAVQFIKILKFANLIRYTNFTNITGIGLLSNKGLANHSQVMCKAILKFLEHPVFTLK